MRRAFLFLLLLPAAARATTLTPATATTGLRWDIIAGNTSNYTPLTFTAGSTISSVFITDQHGNTVTTDLAPPASLSVQAGAPTAPGQVGYVAGGALAQTTYFLQQSCVTFLGETQGNTEVSITVPANNLLQVLPSTCGNDGNEYSLYIATASSAEGLVAKNQAWNATWNEASTGIGTPGVAPPAMNTTGRYGSFTFNSTTITYYAPWEYPPGPTLTLNAITSLNGTQTATVNIQFAHNLQERWISRARIEGFSNFVMPGNGTATTPNIFQAEQIVFRPVWQTYATGTGNAAHPEAVYEAIMPILNPGAPEYEQASYTNLNGTRFDLSTSASVIPFWSYDGKWLDFFDDRCPPGVFCGTKGSSYQIMVARSDGSALQAMFMPGKFLVTSSYLPMWDYNRPNLLISGDTEACSANCNIFIGDVNTWTAFGYNTGSPRVQQPFGDSGGATRSKAVFAWLNPTGCGSPANTAQCPYVPQVFTYDLAACELSLTAGCLNAQAPAGQFAINLGLTFGAEENAGTRHCEVSGDLTADNLVVTTNGTAVTITAGTSAAATWVGDKININGVAYTIATFVDASDFTLSTSAGTQAGVYAVLLACEHHVHSTGWIRGTDNLYLAYGPFGTGGEGIVYKIKYDGTGVARLYPDPTNNVPYMSHYGVDHFGNIAFYSSFKYCNATPSSVLTCAGFPTSAVGDGGWDFRTNTAFGFQSNLPHGHQAGYGEDVNSSGFDGAVTEIDGLNHWGYWKETMAFGLQATYSTQFGDFGVRSSGVLPYGINNGPEMSPDATKLGHSLGATMSVISQPVAWIFATDRPDPPKVLKLASSGANSATISFRNAPANHETSYYEVYRSSALNSGWTQIGTVTSDYWDNYGGGTPAAYTFTDASVPTGTSYYALTSVEYTGAESNRLSQALSLTNTAGTVTSNGIMAAEGISNFYSTPPTDTASVTTTQVVMPTPPAINTSSGSLTAVQATDGTIATGTTVWMAFAHCTYSDFPTNSIPTCSPVGAATSVVVNSPNNAVQVTLPNNLEVGQVAERLYGATGATLPGTLFLQQGDYRTNDLFSPIGNQDMSATKVIVPTISVTTAGPPPTGAIQGYRLSWPASTTTTVRMYDIYRNYGAAVTLSTGELAAQSHLLVSVPAGSQVCPAGTCTWSDNQIDPFNAASTPVHYAIVAVDHLGNRSAGVCHQANPDAVETCN